MDKCLSCGGPVNEVDSDVVRGHRAVEEALYKAENEGLTLRDCDHAGGFCRGGVTGHECNEPSPKRGMKNRIVASDDLIINTQAVRGVKLVKWRGDNDAHIDINFKGGSISKSYGSVDEAQRVFDLIKAAMVGLVLLLLAAGCAPSVTGSCSQDEAKAAVNRGWLTEQSVSGVRVTCKNGELSFRVDEHSQNTQVEALEAVSRGSAEGVARGMRP